MELGVHECKILPMNSGMVYRKNYTLETAEEIEAIDENGSYKHLAYQKSKLVHHKEKRITEKIRRGKT